MRKPEILSIVLAAGLFLATFFLAIQLSAAQRATENAEVTIRQKDACVDRFHDEVYPFGEGTQPLEEWIDAEQRLRLCHDGA